MYKKQVCVCEENRRICVVLGGSRNGFGSGLTGLILPDPVYYCVLRWDIACFAAKNKM